MSDVSPTEAFIHIKVLPAPNEATDIDTLALVKDVQIQLWKKLSNKETSNAELVSDHTRDAGTITLVVTTLASVVGLAAANKELLSACLIVLQNLASRKQVKKIQLKQGEDSLAIDNPNQKNVDQLCENWIKNHPGAIGPSTIIEIEGTISKKDDYLQIE